MKRVVYLAGLISTDFPESLAWRERIAPKLTWLGFSVRTPMQGKKNLKNETVDGGINSTSLTSRDIILRDRRDVREADIILAHLESFGSPRPLLGTIAELAWAWDQRVTVIGIAAEDNYLMRKHPFMAEFIAHYVSTEEEAAAFLGVNFSPYQSEV